MTEADAGDGLTLWELIRSDLDEAKVWWGGWVLHFFPNVFVAVSYRVAHHLENLGLRPFAYAVSILCSVLTGAEIRPPAQIGPGFVVQHPVGIVIGPDVVAGRGLTMFGKNTIGRVRNPQHPLGGSPVIGDNVRIGTTASLLGPIKIGNDVQIGAHCLVVHDVPDGGRTTAPVATVSGPRAAADGHASRPASG
jgi:serine O-acetyltransferase